MQFTTQIPIPKSDHPIDYNSRIVSLGSCFAVNIGEKFQYFKFRSSVNPFGILFHPLAIGKLVSYAASEKTFAESDIFHLNDCWHCFDAHSDLNATRKDTMLSNLNRAVADFRGSLSKATHVVITLGTSWVYRHAASGNIVANCHKVPQKEFTKELLSVEAILQSLRDIWDTLQSLNPGTCMVLTISPVRHLKDGFIENQWSKSNLISAVHQFIALNRPGVSYFPSYEIMMDELRDYRFYDRDMVHPNQLAIDHIWEKFTEAAISGEALPIMKAVSAIQKSLSHKPFNPHAASHRDFELRLQDSIAALQKQFPHIAF